jgi:Spy/CpxP family protein refolding chaperone
MKFVRTLAITGLLMMGLPAFADNQTTVDVPQQIVAQARGPVSFAKVAPVTSDQREKLSALRDKYELDTAQQKALLRVTQRQLREVMTATSVDKSAASALQTKINGLRDDLSNAKLNFMLAAGDVFTPEQRAAFRHMHGRFGHHGFGRGGECGPGCGHGEHGGQMEKKVG